jgi:hypothetical protein
MTTPSLKILALTYSTVQYVIQHFLHLQRGTFSIFFPAQKLALFFSQNTPQFKRHKVNKNIPGISRLKGKSKKKRLAKSPHFPSPLCFQGSVRVSDLPHKRLFAELG